MPRGATPLQVLARARVHDPLTSVRAAREANETGRAGTQAAWFLQAVREHPGLTASELARLSGGQYDRYAANRRLSDLERAGMVRAGNARPSELSGRAELTWFPLGGEPAQMELL